MFLAICGLTLPATAQLAPPDTADLIIFAQRVHVMAPGAKDGVAVAIRGTRILAVSTRIGVLRYRGAQTRLVRLNGAHVFPGLIDAHGDILGNEWMPSTSRSLRLRSRSRSLPVVSCSRHTTRCFARG